MSCQPLDSFCRAGLCFLDRIRQCLVYFGDLSAQHNCLLGARTGEARHPGPDGMHRLPPQCPHVAAACFPEHVAQCCVYFGAAGTNHNCLNSMRAGEASHPGPKPQAALQAFIKQAVQQALQQAIASFDLSAFLRGQIPSQQPAAATLPPGTRAGRRKRAKLKKAAAKLARAGGSQGVSAVPSAAANAEAGAPKGAKAKTKGRSQGPDEGRWQRCKG